MRIQGNYHTHTRYDDGKGELGEYVQAAQRLGWKWLGFSGHAPMEAAGGDGASWLMSPEALACYLRDFRALKASDTGGLGLLLGLEADYLPGRAAPSRELGGGLDYVIGSVHYVNPGWTVDGPAEVVDRGLRENFGGSVERLVRAYYDRVADMVRTSPPDIVGHIDVVKKNNRGGRLFDESATWYREAAVGALDAVRAAGCVVELNTGGLIRGTTVEAYPSPWLLEECCRRQIPIVVSSDAHRPEHLDGYFDHALRMLERAGYRSRVELTERGWVARDLAAEPGVGKVTSPAGTPSGPS